MKKTIILFLFFWTTIAYAEPTIKSEKTDSTAKYKSFTKNKTEDLQDVIETELFGKRTFDCEMMISKIENGIFLDYCFYKIDDDYLCLGIKAWNELQDEAVVYINTQNEYGSKCEVYLRDPENTQIFYIWDPFKETITSNSKEKIVIKTNKNAYTFFAREDITGLELFGSRLEKIVAVEGLENFLNLENVSFVGFGSGYIPESYNELMQKASSYQWHNNMSDAKKALKLTKKAIKQNPKIWNAYSLELNIYASWCHKSKDFSNNFEAVKAVYEIWISNGNKLNASQKLGYANTLYCLNDFANSKNFYSEIIDYYKSNPTSLTKNEKDYFCYIFANIMLYDVDEEFFNSIKLIEYEASGLNDHLLEEIKNLEQSGKKELAERYCVS